MLASLGSAALDESASETAKENESTGDHGCHNESWKRRDERGGQALNRDPDLIEIDHQASRSRE
jgi:hypothetical protein